MTDATATYAVTYTKGDQRYYVALDGVRLGWVLKAHDGGWKVFATVRNATEGQCIGWDRSRQAAVEDALSTLAIRHGGRVVRLDLDRDSDTYMQDVPVWFERDVLKATADHLSDVRYGLA